MIRRFVNSSDDKIVAELMPNGFIPSTWGSVNGFIPSSWGSPNPMHVIFLDKHLSRLSTFGVLSTLVCCAYHWYSIHYTVSQKHTSQHIQRRLLWTIRITRSVLYWIQRLLETPPKLKTAHCSKQNETKSCRVYFYSQHTWTVCHSVYFETNMCAHHISTRVRLGFDCRISTHWNMSWYVFVKIFSV